MGEDLLSAIVASSKAYADPLVAAYASGNRVYHVVIDRPGSPGVFDRDSGQWTGRTRLTVYDGPARIWPDAGDGTREVGDEQIPFSTVRLSIDQPAIQPWVDDVVRVISDAQSIANNIAGRIFEVTGVEIGGHFATGVTLSATGAAPSRHDPGT